MYVKPLQEPGRAKPIGLMVPGGAYIDGSIIPWDRIPKDAKLYCNDPRDISARFDNGQLIANTFGKRGKERTTSWTMPSGKRISFTRRVLPQDAPIETRYRMLTEYLNAFLSRGANLGSFAGISMSLLRANLDRPILEKVNDLPVDFMSNGGRQIIMRPGYFTNAALWDIKHAYPSTLGDLAIPVSWKRYNCYGNRLPKVPSGFARAVAHIPDLYLSPLPVAYHRRTDYPVNTDIMGVWTFNEIYSAMDAGCRVEVLEYWVGGHYQRPFGAWWGMMQDIFRELSGPPLYLAKIAANGFVGGFAANGRRSSKWYENGTLTYGEVSKRMPTLSMPTNTLVVSSIRNRLWEEVCVPYAGAVIAAHTDGAILFDEREIVPNPHGTEPGTWRKKATMTTLNIWKPQVYMYSDQDFKIRYVCSGAETQEEAKEMILGFHERKGFYEEAPRW